MLRFLIVATVLGGSFSAAVALAPEYKLGDLEIVHPWARATIGQSKNSVAFMTIENHGSQPDGLLRAISPVAAKVELHEHKIENDIAQMRSVETVDLPAGGSVQLKPGGVHLMLIDLNRKLVEYDSFPLTLVFERAGQIEIDVEVEGPGAAEPGHE